jgi:hypothetical protein
VKQVPDTTQTYLCRMPCLLTVHVLTTVPRLPDLIGAETGGTWAIADLGWVPKDRQIGQTGKNVSPELYIACGMSGSLQNELTYIMSYSL